MRPFFSALGFLTIVPVPEKAAAQGMTGATPYFPLVGGLIGGTLALAHLLPWAPLPRASVMLAISVIVTGGLHEDAWADVADAASAPVPLARRLDILKDPRVGAHGVVATVVLLLIRFTAFTSAPISAVVAAPVVGRWIMVLSLGVASPILPRGLGAELALEARPASASLGAVALLGALLGTAPALSVLCVVLSAGAAAFLLGTFLVRRFGGLNGDGHGAVGILAETVVLFTWLPWKGAWSLS